MPRFTRSSRPARRRRLPGLLVERLEDRCTPSSAFLETDLVSNISGQAQHTDANLVNPWGMSYAPGGEWWFSDNGSGKSTLYDGSGTVNPLVVGIPAAPGSAAGTLGSPTGTVYNSDGAGFGGTLFLFDTEDGTISGWNGAQNAAVEVNNSANPSAADGAVYKGLAMGTDAANQSLLYAANFRAGTIDVFTSTFQATTVSGHFSDPNIPAGYAPFNIQDLNGKLYVTYALQDAAKHDPVTGAGNGYVDVFSTDGVLQSHLVAQGNLNAPWGLAIAPSGFGSFAGALLVGNFGDGHINAYDPSTGTFLGAFDGSSGNPIDIDGLWGLTFGNGGQAGPTTTLYFTAGPNNETDGLFGSLTVTTGKTSTTTQLAASTGTAVFGQTVTLTATVAPTSGSGVPTSGSGVPTGTVTFMDGSSALGTGNLAVNGGLDQASVNVTSLTVGSHAQLTASYGGDSDFSNSATTTSASVTVTAADTTTSLHASATTADFGQTVTLTAVVAPVAPSTGTPTGTVTFSNGTTVLGTGTLGIDPGTGNDVATLAANLPVGTYDDITASYATDGNYDASDSTNAPIALTVNQAITLPPTPLPADTVGIAYLQTLTASGGSGDVTLTVTAVTGATGSLDVPAGGTNTLTIDGTPGEADTVAFTVTATDTVGGSLVRNYSFVVNPAISFQSATLPVGAIGVDYDGTIAALDAAGNVTSTSMGNLYAGSSTYQLTQLVDTWFLGMDEPDAAKAYSAAQGTLFGSGGPVYTDVQQGDVGDCWLLASAAEVAARDPGYLTSMFTYEGTNTVNGATVSVYSVRMYSREGFGVPHYVTVDTELPASGGLYDHPTNGVLWAALLEKAYAEASGAGWVVTANGNSDSYGVLEGGYPSYAIPALTNLSTSEHSINASAAATAFQAGDLVCLCTSSPSSSEIVPDHCYALVAYTPSSSSPFKVYNPWGAAANGNALGDYDNHSVYGLFNATAAFINSNFNQDSIGAAVPEPDVLDSLASTQAGASAQGPSSDALLLALVEATQASHGHDGCWFSM